jgi:hypothetical protein
MLSRLSAKLPPVNALRIADAKDFGGGLNTYDTPNNLSRKFATALRNLYPDTNGRLKLRYGTSIFADLSADVNIDEIIGMEYFNTALIVAFKNGKIYSINASGVSTVRWNAAIAGGAGAWSTGLTFVSFTQFNGSLIICNGVDKPLIMSAAYATGYLVDLGTGSNLYVPRAKYCATHANHVVLAVTPTDDSTIYVSMQGTSGTYFGAPGANNNGTNFNTSTYVARGSIRITGMTAFRDKLILSFAETILAIQFGAYDTSKNPHTHTLVVADTIENFGSVSAKTVLPLGDDVLLLDKAGVASVQRALITGNLSPVRESTLISVTLQNALKDFTPAQLEQYTFCAHDRIAQHMMFFIPKSTTVTSTTDNHVFVYCFDRAQRFKAWTYFDGMPYRSTARSAENRTFFATNNKIWYYRNQYDPLYNDASIVGAQTWDDGTSWDDATGWIGDTGSPIQFEFEMPWSDLREPGKIKQSKYFATTFEGAASVLADMYIDGIASESLSADFTQTDFPVNGEDFPRPSNNAQLIAWPQKFESFRLRFTGSAISFFSIVAIRIAYLVGSIRR